MTVSFWLVGLEAGSCVFLNFQRHWETKIMQKIDIVEVFGASQCIHRSHSVSWKVCTWLRTYTQPKPHRCICRAPLEYGISNYRTKVQYVPQRPSILPGTPRLFLETVLSFKSRKGIEKYSSAVDGPVELAERWGIDSTCWDRSCSSALYALEHFISFTLYRELVEWW